MSFLTNMAIGAGLGAVTNELAIQWILRRILPRKKNVIAQRIQQLFSTELMTPEKLRDKLDSTGIAEIFHRNVDQFLSELLGRELPAPSVCFAGHIPELDRLGGRLRDMALDELLARCGTEAFRETVLRPWIAREIEPRWHRSPRSLLPEPVGRMMAAVPGWVEGLEQSVSLRRNAERMLTAWLGDRMRHAKTLHALLPPAGRTALLDWVEEQSAALGDQVASLLAAPEVSDMLGEAINGAIKQQLNSQGTFGRLKGHMADLIGVDEDVRGLCRRLPDVLREHLSRPEARARFGRALRQAAEDWLRCPIDPTFLDPGVQARWVKTLLEHLWTRETFAELGRRLQTALEEASQRSLAETCFRMGLDFDPADGVEVLTLRVQGALTSPETKVLLASKVDEALAEWREKPLGRLERLIPEAMRKKVSPLVADEARRLIQARLGTFADESGLWDIVTESINAYDNKQIGNMVIQLARSELHMVTILGGVIGAVVGFFQTFLQ